jgi:hypothetical protein
VLPRLTPSAAPNGVLGDGSRLPHVGPDRRRGGAGPLLLAISRMGSAADLGPGSGLVQAWHCRVGQTRLGWAGLGWAGRGGAGRGWAGLGWAGWSTFVSNTGRVGACASLSLCQQRHLTNRSNTISPIRPRQPTDPQQHHGPNQAPTANRPAPTPSAGCGAIARAKGSRSSECGHPVARQWSVAEPWSRWVGGSRIAGRTLVALCRRSRREAGRGGCSGHGQEDQPARFEDDSRLMPDPDSGQLPNCFSCIRAKK